MMSHQRQQALLRGCTEVARKVFAIIPIAEAWSYQQIHAELQRRGANMGWNVMQGCIAALAEAGLVKRSGTLRSEVFSREPAKPARDNSAEESEEIEVMPQESNITPIKTTKAVVPAGSPTDRLGALAARIRTMSDVAISLHHEAVKVADMIDDIALGIEESGEANAKALQDLTQLRTLLKNIGMGAN